MTAAARACQAGLLLAALGGAQPSASWRVEGLPAAAVVGESFALTVVRSWPRGAAPPAFDAAALLPLRLAVDARTRRAAGDRVEETLRCRGYAFVPGEHDIAGARLTVRSALAAGAGREVELPGGLLALPAGRRWWPWLGGALALGSLLLFVWRGARARRSAAAPQADAHVVAESRLAALRAAPRPRDLAEEQALHDELAALLRGYAAARFALPAAARTTEELRVVASGLPPGLEPLLEQCDQVRFARAPVTDDQRLARLEAAAAWLARAEQEA